MLYVLRCCASTEVTQNTPLLSKPKREETPCCQCCRQAVVTTTVTACVVAGGSETGSEDGRPGTTARFNHPTSLAFLQDGSIAVAESGSNSLRKLVWDGEAFTVSTVTSSSEQPEIHRQLNNPMGMTSDDKGSLYICDWNNHCIRVVGNVL